MNLFKKFYGKTHKYTVIPSLAFIFGGFLFMYLVAGYDIEHNTFNTQLALFDLSYFAIAYLFASMRNIK